MEVFIHVVIGLLVSEFWHGERENAGCTTTKIICLFGEYGSYILTLIYLYQQLV